ncbi:hypothetical protein CWI75_08915 [Kineobactrum sediminis]|uniref:Transcriptional regulator SutA RNAP-binding domain-containing protein n=1 Tax=Kineobactrum sediminis TaxID=1905677 RepID=A0A2N5Y2R9_9GAMM|nr:hypothetical protein [Kineobactrum sediminis]PLW82693.1 hypothetical protein CWI75_08915 [Kineobactrum sediminis]
MKKPVTKADLRAALEQETKQFLNTGGTVDAVPLGTSGKDPLAAPLHLTQRLFLEPRAERTPVPEVVATIEARRRALRKRSARQTRTVRSQPKRKTIYDDFGEPLRKIWVED